MKRRWIGAAAAAILGIFVALAIVIKSRSVPQLTEAPGPRLVGAFHAHSEDSHDSSLTWDTLAMAARARGLDFLIITDHNKQRPASASLHGVTLLSYAELSTGFGHAVNLGAGYVIDKQARAAPDVVQAMRRAGGFVVLTHPADLKRPWRGPQRDLGGIEIANISASARRAGGPLMLGLLPLAAAWPLQRELAFAQLYDRDAGALAMWDAQPPETIGLCGSDTHGWIDPALNLSAWSLVLDDRTAPVPPPGPGGTAGQILQAVRAGHFHCSAGLLGRAPTFGLQALPKAASQGVAAAAPLTTAAGDIAALRVTGPETPTGAVELVLIKDGRVWRRGAPPELSVQDPPPGIYRAEARVRMPRLVAGAVWVPAMYSQRIRLTGRQA